MAKNSNPTGEDERDERDENQDGDDSQGRKDGGRRGYFDDEDSDEEDKDEEEDDSDEEGDDEEELDDEASKKSLAAYNKRVGKDYKSWDDVAKSEKERDKALADKGRQPKKEAGNSKPQTPVSATEERLLKLEDPSVVHVLDELKEDAKASGKSVLELWDKSSYYKKEAKARAEAKAEEEKNKGNVSSPSRKVGSAGKIDYSTVKTDEDIAKLTPAQRAEFVRVKAKQERGG